MEENCGIWNEPNIPKKKKERLYCCNCKNYRYQSIGGFIKSLSRECETKNKCVYTHIDTFDTPIVKYTRKTIMADTMSPFTLNIDKQCVNYSEANMMRKFIIKLKLKYYKYRF